MKVEAGLDGKAQYQKGIPVKLTITNNGENFAAEDAFIISMPLQAFQQFFQEKQRLLHEHTFNFSLPMKALGEYEVTFTADEPDVYYLQLSEKEGETITGTFTTGVVVPYSEEYKFQEQNRKLLEEIASVGGRKPFENPEEAFSKELPKHFEKQDVFYLLLALALLLFLFDAAAGRFDFLFAFLGGIKRAVEKKNEEKKTIIANKQTQFEKLKKAIGSHPNSLKKNRIYL